LRQEIGVIDVTNEDVPGHFLLLEMTFQAKRCVAFVEQPLVHGAVRRMADGTSLPHCFVLINKRTALRGVALEASFVSAQESKPAGSERLLNIRATAFDGDPFMRIVAIAAAHFSFQHRMMMRQLELRPRFQVTLETSFRRLPRINDRVRRAATLDMQTARPMAGLAAHVLRVLTLCHQTRVRRCSEVAHDFFVASLTFFRANELRARNAGRCQNCPAGGAARKQNHGQRGCSPDAPQNFFALTVDPSSWPRIPHEWRVLPKTPSRDYAFFRKKTLIFFSDSIPVPILTPRRAAEHPPNLFFAFIYWKRAASASIAIVTCFS
jgi:hypothetical protein